MYFSGVVGYFETKGLTKIDYVLFLSYPGTFIFTHLYGIITVFDLLVFKYVILFFEGKWQNGKGSCLIFHVRRCKKIWKQKKKSCFLSKQKISISNDL